MRRSIEKKLSKQNQSKTACLNSIVITSQGGVLLCPKGNFFPQIFLYRLFTHLIFPVAGANCPLFCKNIWALRFDRFRGFSQIPKERLDDFWQNLKSGYLHQPTKIMNKTARIKTKIWMFRLHFKVYGAEKTWNN